MGNPVVHFEINGPDGEALSSFYSGLFGWHVQSMPEMGYGVVDTHAGEGINGGIGTTDDGSTSVRFYVSADDIQGVLDRAEALGGKTVVPITEMSMVTFALLADPEGQVVGVVWDDPSREAQGPSEGDGAAIDWFEILGTDPAKIQGFYTELFGWELEDEDDFPGYRTTKAHTAGDAGGGIGAGDGSTWVTLYARVDKIDKALARAEELGGSKVYGPNDVMEGLRTAAFTDPAGNVFGLYSSST